MKENIEEEIKVLEKLKNKKIYEYDYQFAVIYGVCALYEKEEQAIDHILSDYKRVLKENDKKDELIERMKRFLLKENKMCDYLDYKESEE